MAHLITLWAVAAVWVISQKKQNISWYGSDKFAFKFQTAKVLSFVGMSLGDKQTHTHTHTHITHKQTYKIPVNKTKHYLFSDQGDLKR